MTDLTAKGLISRLKELPEDTLILLYKSDSEYMCSYVYAIEGVSDTGVLGLGSLLRTVSDWPEDFEDYNADD